MFNSKKTKEKSEVEKVIENSKSTIEYLKREIDKLYARIEEEKYRLLKEELLVEELTKREEIVKQADKFFDKILKSLK